MKYLLPPRCEEQTTVRVSPSSQSVAHFETQPATRCIINLFQELVMLKRSSYSHTSPLLLTINNNLLLRWILSSSSSGTSLCPNCVFNLIWEPRVLISPLVSLSQKEWMCWNFNSLLGREGRRWVFGNPVTTSKSCNQSDEWGWYASDDCRTETKKKCPSPHDGWRGQN